METQPSLFGPIVLLIVMAILSIVAVIVYSCGKCEKCGFWITYRKMVQEGTKTSPFFRETKNCPRCKDVSTIKKDIID